MKLYNDIYAKALTNWKVDYCSYKYNMYDQSKFLSIAVNISEF